MEPESLGEPSQEGDEFATPGIAAEVGDDFFFVLESDAQRRVEELAPGGGEMEEANPAIARIGATLEQASLGEGIDDGHHPARRDVERLGERLLGAPLVGSDEAEDEEVAGLQVQRCEPSPELARDDETELGEEEPDAPQALGRLERLLDGGHTYIVPCGNHSGRNHVVRRNRSVGAEQSPGSGAQEIAFPVRASSTAPTSWPQAPADDADPDPRRWIALGVVLSAAFMILIDISIVNVAIPSIQRDLGATNAEIQFVIAGYQLAYALLLITGGRLGDIYGRKRLFCLGMGGFVAASAACGLAPNASVLVASRVVQGLMAALMYPQVLSVIQVNFPPRERGAAFGVFGAVLGIASITGPLLGGLLIGDDVSGGTWRRIFLVNVPIGVVSLVAAVLLLHESRAPQAKRLDVPGVLIVSTGLFLLTYPLVEGREAGWPLWAYAMLVACLPVLAGFVLFERWKVQRGDTSPLVELSLFRLRSFSVGVLVTIVFLAGVPAFFLVFSLTLQIGLGFSPLHAGLLTSPFAVGSALGSALSHRLAQRLGKTVLEMGATILAVGMAGLLAMALALGTTLHGPEVTPLLLMCGFGLGCVVAPLITVILSTVPPRDAGSASGIITTAQQIGGAIGVAVIGVIFFGALAGRAGDVARSVAPSLEHRLVAAGVPAPAAPLAVAQFETCFRDRAASNDPLAEPPSCVTLERLAASHPASNAVRWVFAETAASAIADDFVGALERALVYEIVVFAVTAILAAALPRRSAPRARPVVASP